MKVVGLTGGIGSGKTTVAAMFKKLGVAVYIADKEAKKVIMLPEVKSKIIDLLGKEAFTNEIYNNNYVASVVFKDKTLLKKLNAIIHPAVKLHFEQWKKNQKGTYVIKEAAILFESGSYQTCDKTILVISSKNKRIQRVVNRDNTTEEAVVSRIKNQWSDQRNKALADEIIYNNDTLENLKEQVEALHFKLLYNFY